MRHTLRWNIALLVSMCLVGLAAPLSAQPDQSEASKTAPKETTDSETSEQETSDDESASSKLSRENKEQLLSLLKRAREAFSAGNFQESFNLLQKAYSLKPDPEYLYRMGLCQERLNAPEKALKYYRKYLEEKPDSDRRGSVEKTIEQLEPKVDDTDEASPEADDTAGSTRPWAIATTSVAGASTIAAIIFGILYGSADSQYHTMLDNPRSNTRSAIEQQARQSNAYLGVTIATAGLAVASGGVSTFLWLRGGPERNPSSRQASSTAETELDLGVRFGLGGFQLKGRF